MSRLLFFLFGCALPIAACSGRVASPEAPDAAACTSDECGPEPGMASWTCPDGSTGGPTGRCVRGESGRCAWEIRQCPPAKTCGAIPNGACADDEYCKHARGTCLVPGALGTCWLRPETCTAEYGPVCGCDGREYATECTAAAAGVDTLHDGPCAGATCGGLVGARCALDQYCDYPASTPCGEWDATGTCTTRPEACTTEYAPACGCDGKTYGNACEAAMAGVDTRHAGGCAD